MTKFHKNKYLSGVFALALALAGAHFLSACSSSSSSAPIVPPPPPVDQNPSGYYTGTASVKDAANTSDVVITDLTGLVSGNRFMFFSVTEDVLYDGTITDISGADFTATVSIYTDIGMNLNSVTMPLPIDTTISGTITEGSIFSGTFEGTGPGNGNFTLTYSLDNNTPAGSANIDNIWSGDINGANDANVIFTVNAVGALSMEFVDTANQKLFQFCSFSSATDGDSTIIPITGESLYAANMIMSDCNDEVNGTYTGFAFRTSANALVLTFTNGRYGAYIVSAMP